MIQTVLCSYLIGWTATSIGLTLFAGSQRFRVIAVLGAVWPLLALGAAQFVAIALVAEAARILEVRQKSVDDEFDELLAGWATADAVPSDHRFGAATGDDNVHESTAGQVTAN
ncbi:hypothetical protein ACGFK1_09615 [Mycobacterium sp. NPDC048908]|uniref:hypothetical protein n=1 Tax=Mycobacterium sp. NPDC048908 TaxID=3364292 RepID=UPI003710B4B8